jgi:hypothetical protein
MFNPIKKYIIMKNFSIFVLFLFSIHSFAQQNKVIIISNKYEFQKEKNAYNINNMLKAILVSNTYQVFFDDEVLPVEIAQNRCKALTGVLVDNSNMFLTKMKFQIRDCQNNLLFETTEVKTREKDIQNAYIETIGLLSPELKKYNATLIQKKEVVEIPSDVVSSSIAKYQFVQITNGFAIMDATLKVVLQIYNTTNPTIFIADKFGVKGVFTKIANKGIFEYYMNDKLVVEEYLF